MNKVPLLENGCRDLLQYGVWDSRAKCKYLIKRYLLRRETAKEDLLFWPTGLLAAGLWACREEMRKGAQGETTESYGPPEVVQSLQERIENTLAQYYGRWMKRGMPVMVIDDLLAGETLLQIELEMERETRSDWAGLPRDAVRGAIDRLAAYGAAHPVDGTGSFLYRPAHGNMAVFVDGVGLACPFLYRYGAAFGQRNDQELALGQIVSFLSYGMDGGTGLPYHGYDMRDGCKYGIIGWGRAVGWLLRGMAGCLGSDHGSEGLREPFIELADAALAYQGQDGFFTWQLAAREGPADTSATGMICAALKRGIAQGILTDEKYGKALAAGKEALVRSVRDGRVCRCSGECEGFACYPQRYGAYPWSLGPALEVL